jgi:hypothetical protein
MPSTTLDARGGLTRANPSGRIERLDRLRPAGRLAAYRAGRLGLHDLAVWAARYPDEVPTVNGEVEWIALNAE